jgi:hypothetical protein
MSVKEGLYSTVTIPAPISLANSAVSPTLLSARFALYLENMLPTSNKAGSIEKRFGSKLVGNPIGSGNIQNLFEFIKSDGTQQILAYVDTGILYRYDNPTWTSLKSGLNTTNPLGSVAFNNKLVFFNGVDNNFSWDGTTIADIEDTIEDLLATSRTWVDQNTITLTTGTRGATDYPNGRTVYYNITGSGLAITSITRASSTATVTTTSNHNMPTGTRVTVTGAGEAQYNGTFTITYISANSFSYTVSGAPATPATGTITYGFTTQNTSTSTVSSTSLSGSVLTVDTTANIMPAGLVTINSVYFKRKPTAFSYIYAYNDRLYALSSGDMSSTTFRATPANMYLYYCRSINDENSWFSTLTLEQAYLNLRDKHGIGDELIAMAQLDGTLIIFGRHATQIWSGEDPSAIDGFAWQKTVPVGLLQKFLIANLPRDIAFVTHSGVRTFRNVFQTESLEALADLGSDVDPAIEADIAILNQSDANYRRARAFSYVDDGMFGFKIAEKPRIYIISDKTKGWTLFSGVFKDATAYLGTTNNRLYLGKEDDLQVYANGADGAAQLYADAGATIYTVWRSQWVQPANGARWGNVWWRFITEAGSAGITATVGRRLDYDLSTQTEFSVNMDSSYAAWDNALWDVAMWDSQRQDIPDYRDKFNCNSVLFQITTDTATGPFQLTGVKLLGSAR